MPRKSLLFAVLASGWAAVSHSTPAPARGDPTNFFRAPDFTQPAVSPDGKLVAFIAWQNGHSRLFKLELASGKMDGVFDPGQGEVESFWWLGNKRILIAGLGEFGDKYFAQDLDGSKPREVTTLEHTAPEFIAALPNDARHVVATKFVREQYLTRIDVEADRGQRIESVISEPHAIMLSASGEIRGRAYQRGDYWKVSWRPSAASPWHDLEGNDAEPVFWPLAMAKNDHDIIVIARDQGDTWALMSLDPDTGHRTLLAQRPDRDVYRLVPSGPNRYPDAVSFFNPGHDDVSFLDESGGKLYGSLAKALPEAYKRVASSSEDGNIRIIEAWNAGAPSRYYLFEQARGRLSGLGQQYADDSLPPLGEVRFFQYPTRDGVHESGYLLLPYPSPGARPPPVLVLPVYFVGEQGKVADGFDGFEQYLACRGIAVARMVVRGSRGLGKAFQKAGDFKLADVVAHDYEDGLKYLGQENLVDASRVAIFGEGFSGLFTLRMASTTNIFKAVVVRDATAVELNATDVTWLTGRTGGVYSSIKEAGDVKAAYHLVHQFEPESFIGNLSAHALMIYSSDYNLEFYARDAGAIRDGLRRHNKPFEWYLFDLHDYEHRPDSYYQTLLHTKIGDYLVKTLDVAQPPAIAGK